ncbi:hypothetical protein DFH06DRAFT_1339324 [Mycena polygramma]|nr:hypothetical protein DFH06DRAFT_1339324 [Mycena polygramma]
MSESFLPVVLAVFLFFMIPFTTCVLIMLVMGPKRRQSLFRHPRAPLAPATAANVRLPWNNPLDAVRGSANITWLHLQVPPAVLRQMGRSLSASSHRLPGDVEAGTLRLSELYIGVGRINAAPVSTYRPHS